MTTQLPTKQHPQTRALVMLLLLVTLGLRLVFVPLHLASEEHTCSAGVPLLPRAEQHAHGHAHGHDHGHDQGRHGHQEQHGEHDPHPAADHQSELVSSRMASALGSLPTAYLPVVCIHLAPPLQVRALSLIPEALPPPESKTPSASHSRAPPAVV